MNPSLLLVIVIGVGFLIPTSHKIPVAGASAANWNPESFWYHPWGVPESIKASIFSPKRSSGIGGK
ncbi:MAG: hypothetical protein ACXV8I_11455 [Methylobacter sp.]